MDIRHLKYVIAVADTLHFGRAAALLGISQPPLSARIREVEEVCGFPLFVRNTRTVQMTERGCAFVAEARLVADSFDRLMASYSASKSPESPQISLAVPSDTNGELLHEIGELFRKEGLCLDLSERSTTDQLVALRNGSQMLGSIRLPAPIENLTVGRVMSKKLGAVLPAGHRLAGKAAVQLADLKDENLVIFPRNMAPLLYDEMLAVCSAEGWRPRGITHATRLAQAIVASGAGIQFRERSYAQGVPQLVWKPIKDDPFTWRMVLAAAPDNKALFRRFCQPLEDLFLRHDCWSIEPEPGA